MRMHERIIKDVNLNTILGFLHLGGSASAATEADNITKALGFLQPLNADFAAFHKA